MRVYYAHKTPEMLETERAFDPAERFTEKDVILVTYGDLITSPQKKPLRALSDFLTLHGLGYQYRSHPALLPIVVRSEAFPSSPMKRSIRV